MEPDSAFALFIILLIGAIGFAFFTKSAGAGLAFFALVAAIAVPK